MAARKSQLTNSQFESVIAICEIGPLKLQQVVAHLDARNLVISSDDIRTLIAEDVGKENADHLTSFVFGIAVAHRRDEGLPEAILSDVTAMIASRAEGEARLSAWPDCVPSLIKLLQSKSVRAATKAIEVSYDFERIYVDGRFITSVRPIYDAPGSEVIGAAVVQTLRLEFVSSEGDRSTISVAMDKADIERLTDACARAIRKGDAAFKASTTTWKLPTIMPGELEQ